MYDIIIIGAGVSGLGAAIYAGRVQMKTLVIGEPVGGTISLTNDIGNYPGFKHITGLDLAEKIKEHAKEYGTEIIERKATKVEKGKDYFNVFAGKDKFTAKTILFTTGTEWKKLQEKKNLQTKESIIALYVTALSTRIR